MRYFLTVLALFLFQFIGAAEVSLWIDKIEVFKETDLYGDQIYCFILEKDPHGDFAQFTVPSFPFSFTKEGVKAMKPFVVWHEVFVEDDVFDIIFSLFDREVMPWLPDELLGHLRLSMLLKNGHLETQWQPLSAHTSIETLSSDMERRILMRENGGDYAISLRLNVKN
jgi:hypothetical protein